MYITNMYTLLAVTFLILGITSYPIHPTAKVVHWSDVLNKCCDTGYAFNEDLQCVHVNLDRLNYTTHDVWQTISLPHLQRIISITAPLQSLNHLNCRNSETNPRHPPDDFQGIHSIFFMLNDYCMENMTNGTTVLVKCARVDSEMNLEKESSIESTVTMKTTVTTTTVTTITTINMMKVSSPSKNEEVVRHCKKIKSVYFWGAQTYINTNIVHIVLSTIVVLVYSCVPELGKSNYNRSVICHNVCLMLQGVILLYLAYCNICYIPINDNLAIFFWILMQFFTNATVFWLNVICFDIAQSITRLRWMIRAAQQTSRERNMRFLMYSAFVWGGAFLLALVAVIFEFYPGIPEDTPLKPNYIRYKSGPHYAVRVYFFGLPLLTLFFNNLLFAFTTYKIRRIQQKMEKATNNINNLKKKYFLFLQIYLLMGAPWFFGLLFAFMNKLLILKICRMIWPILWLLMLINNKKLRYKIVNKLPCLKNTTK